MVTPSLESKHTTEERKFKHENLLKVQIINLKTVSKRTIFSSDEF